MVIIFNANKSFDHPASEPDAYTKGREEAERGAELFQLEHIRLFLLVDVWSQEIQTQAHSASGPHDSLAAPRSGCLWTGGPQDRGQDSGETRGGGLCLDHWFSSIRVGGQ